MSSPQSNEDVARAIWLAAQRVELNPDDFDFGAIRIPTCGSPGCALGWVGHYAGVRAPSTYSDVARSILRVPGRFNSFDGSPHFNFYRRMGRLTGTTTEEEGGWGDSATVCAVGLRKYAARYHHIKSPGFAFAMFRAMCNIPALKDVAP